VLTTNLRSVMLGCKHAIPAMLKRGSGSIINTSSDSAFLADIENHAYAAAKAGVNTLTKYVAAGFGKQGIRCNAIAPGVHLSDEEWRRLEAEESERAEVYSLIREHCMLPRLGTPEDIANAAIFLASEDAAYVTGQIISVDGGFAGVAPQLAQVRRLRER
jgi:NAD(P)-dependent dehydrogenase (short-subunit alcohol dehydrogenase family)